MMDHKGLKATNEWHDDGTGVFHQVVQHSVDRVYTRRPCSSLPIKT